MRFYEILKSPASPSFVNLFIVLFKMASLEEEEDLCERGQYSEDIEIKIAEMHSGEK